MRIMAIFCLFLCVNAYAQNRYPIVKANRKAQKVARVTVVSPVHARLAYNTISRRALNLKLSVNSQRAIVTAVMKQPACHPTKMVGGYNYLRITSKKFKSLPQWRGVTEGGLYNGVHHVVTQTVIDAIAKEMDIQDTKEMKANAPAIYSPLHGNPRYSDLFHDHKELLELYHAKGVYGIVVTFFERLNEKHKELGIPLYEKEAIKTELREAELWAKHWGIRWR